MTPIRILGLLLLIAGILAVAYGGFTVPTDRHTAELGPLSVSVTEKETFKIPLWVGVGVAVLGGVLLAVGGKRR